MIDQSYLHVVSLSPGIFKPDYAIKWLLQNKYHIINLFRSTGDKGEWVDMQAFQFNLEQN